MTDRESFLAAIGAAPADDTPRLVFADWLDEHGESERAEFIRVQIALVALEREETERFNEDTDWSNCTGIAASWCPNCGDCACRDREESMSDDDCPLHGCGSLHCCLEDIDRREVKLRSREQKLHWITQHSDHVFGAIVVDDHVFRRGFVAEVTLSAADFLAHTDALLAAQPITRVRLTTWPVLDYLSQTVTLETPPAIITRWLFVGAGTFTTALLPQLPRMESGTIRVNADTLLAAQFGPAFELPPTQEEIMAPVATALLDLAGPPGATADTPFPPRPAD